MALTEDRRRITARLMVLQVGVVVAFAALAISFWFLQIVQHTKFEEMAENNHQRTLALRAPRGVLFDRNGKVLVENRHSFTISIVREHTKDLDRTIRLLSGVAGLDEADVQADRRSASRRADATGRSSSSRTRRWRRWRPSRRGGSISSCRTSSSRKCRRASIRPTRWRRTCSATSARPATRRSATASRSGAIVGQSGIERVYNKLLMGAGRRASSSSSTASAARSGTLEEMPPIEGRRVQLTIDYDLQKAAEDGFRHAGLQRRGADHGSAQRRSADATSACRPTTRTISPPASIARRGRRSTPTSCGRCRTARSRDATRRDRRSRSSSRLAALEEGLITPDFRVNCCGRREFLRPLLPVLHLKGGHGSVDMRHAIEKSCNVFFYTRRQHARRGQDPQVGRRSSAWRARPASTCRTSRRAWCRPPSGSGSATARSGTPARRSRWRSARGRSR